MKGIYKTSIALLLVLVLCPLFMFFSSAWWLPKVAGYWLPAGSYLTMDSRLHIHRGALSVAGLHYRVADCDGVAVKNIRLSYPGHWQMDADELNVAPDCLAALSPQSSGDDKPLVLSELQQLLPESRINIQQFIVSSLPQYQGAVQLALSAGQQRLDFQGPLLSARLTLDQQALAINAFTLRLSEESPPFELAGQLTLNMHPDGIPPAGELSTQLLSPMVPEPLDISLRWQKNQGLLQVTEPGQESPLLSLPWSADSESVEITDGQWRWPYVGFPLQGGLTLRADNWQQGLDETRLSGRMNIVSEGQAGKGNVVLNIGPGKLSLIDSALPLRLNGEIKYQQLILYALLNGELSGPLLDPGFTFRPGSLLTSRGRINEALNIDDVRWPLAGVHISSQGIDGRLQAILRARQNFLGSMTLHLDGKAQQFFPYSQNGVWQWRYWGNGRFAPVEAQWDVRGEGEWQGEKIIFSSLSTGFDKLAYADVYVSKPRLRLTRPLIWDSNEQQPRLSGDFVLETGKTSFGRSSELPPAALNFSLTGRTPADFQFKGALQAEAIGPVRLSGRWSADRLRGEAWWPKQSLSVFQPLLPVDWKTDLKGGEFYAQVAFSAAQKQGFAAGGHGVVSKGSAWLPDNQFNGIDFVLPFRYQQSRWHLGSRGPVSLRIAEIRNQFLIQNITADLQGWYPWNEQKPLLLTDVSAELLGGKISMQQLRMPQRDAALIRLSNLSSSELMKAINPKQFTFSGKVDGGLPFWINHPHWIVKDGWLTSPGAMTFRMDKDMADAIADNNIAAGAAINWIRYLEITRSWARVSLDNLGEMVMSATVTGVSRLDGKTISVNLNYHHEENLFSLWRSLRFGENLQTWLEENAALPLVSCDKPGNVCEEKQ